MTKPRLNPSSTTQFHDVIKTLSMNDRKKIELYLAGDAAGFQAIDTWLRRALRTFHRRLGEALDDLVGDCHLDLVQRLGRGEFRAEAGLRTYIWRVAQNRSIDYLRRHEGWDLMELDTVVADLVSPLRAADKKLVDKELAHRILSAMPEDCRKLWMQIAWGLSYQEMSENLGIRKGTLRVRVRRCREKVDRFVSDLEG